MSDPVRKLSLTAEDQEAEQFKAAVEEGRAAIDRGAFVDHERVREWLTGIAAGKKVSRPRS